MNLRFHDTQFRYPDQLKKNKYIYLIHEVNITDFTAFKFTQYFVCNIVTQIKLSRASLSSALSGFL